MFIILKQRNYTVELKWGASENFREHFRTQVCGGILFIRGENIFYFCPLVGGAKEIIHAWMLLQGRYTTICTPLLVHFKLLCQSYFCKHSEGVFKPRLGHFCSFYRVNFCATASE
uniref:Uncharacterized protein n=1 Tax=Anguilla anguilla TaxID=7936 RepID=A0A0E9X505_ANGAN